MRIANQKHDVVALKVYDKRETEMPAIGLIKLKDAETGEYQWVDTSSKQVRDAYANWWRTVNEQTNKLFTKCGVDT